MTTEDETKIKEYLFQAIQSGKKETSGLVADLKSHILNTQALAEAQIKLASENAKKLLEVARKEAEILIHDSTLVPPRFIDVSRVPLICQSILVIEKRLEGIEGNLMWGVRIIVGAVLLGLLGLVLK